MYDRILIPVDGSDEATRAARRGLDLARRFDAAVDVLHVIDRRSSTRTSDEQAQLRERGEEIVGEIERLAADHDQSVTTTVTDGSPAARIARLAADYETGLIVIGRQGITGLGKRLLGGVTEGVLHRSDVPVLVVPTGDQSTGDSFDYDRLLVPTDGSDNATRAAPRASAVAQQCGATAHVLSVIDLQAAGGAFSAGGLEESFVDRLEDEGEAIVDELAAEIDATGDVDVETAVEKTSLDGVAAEIREYIGAHDIDLVVMGSHGRSNLRRQLLGSVSGAVLRSVDVPILIVTRS
ncbi:nucleotide-binding universal stress UspA family protein [Natrinema hispanicum]|uniref:Nucleotide-binding universal stress UspA family protein n=1 Tax=Natrinema hispanicum TaxID=392421 RepID=A0A482Y8L5_9EURY|nr:universal stress protein [Natrinema hispanicum]RZV11563.1 nucleotide-binding universal stress UspA family protein [Natrinema hispanicum]